jgi:hypothetical protein
VELPVRHLLFVLTIALAALACGGTPTPSEAESHFATYEAEIEPKKDARQAYFDCMSKINNDVGLLEKKAHDCSDDYDCRAKIAQEIEELANNLYSTCSPVPGDLLSDLHCKSRIIEARASYVHGAPNETGATRVMAEETLADQVKEAYESCFSSRPEPGP